MAKKRIDPWQRMQGWLSEEEVEGLRSLTINGVVQFVTGGILRYGKKTADSTNTGFWLGVDPSDKKAKLHFGNASFYIYWTGTYLRLKALYLTIDEAGIRIETRNDIEARLRFMSSEIATTELFSMVDTDEDTARSILRTLAPSSSVPDATAKLEAVNFNGTAASVTVTPTPSPHAVVTNALEVQGDTDSANYILLAKTTIDPTTYSGTAALVIREKSSKLQLSVVFKRVSTPVEVLLATEGIAGLSADGIVVGATSQAQAFTTGLRVGAGWGADDTAINVKRTLTGVVNSHGYRDESALTPAAGSTGYCAFDSQYTLAGAVTYDHFANFQARPVFSGSGTITKAVGFWSLPVHSGAGTITNLWHNYVRNVTGGGPVTYQVGLYIEELTAASSENWAIVTLGATPSYFGGNVTAASGLKVSGRAAFGADISTSYQILVSTSLDATKSIGLAVAASAPVNVSSGSSYGAYLSNLGDNNTLASIGTNHVIGVYSRAGLGASSANSAASTTRGASFQINYSASTGKTAQSDIAYGVLIDDISATGAGTITIGATVGVGIKNQGTAKATAAYGLFIESQSGSTTNYALYTGAGDVRLMASNSDKIGFHGVTPVARQLLATGAGRTVDEVITALQTLGLVKQS